MLFVTDSARLSPSRGGPPPSRATRTYPDTWDNAGDDGGIAESGGPPVALVSPLRASRREGAGGVDGEERDADKGATCEGSGEGTAMPRNRRCGK